LKNVLCVSEQQGVTLIHHEPKRSGGEHPCSGIGPLRDRASVHLILVVGRRRVEHVVVSGNRHQCVPWGIAMVGDLRDPNARLASRLGVIIRSTASRSTGGGVVTSG
jgi:hypothetical protein